MYEPRPKAVTESGEVQAGRKNTERATRDAKTVTESGEGQTGRKSVERATQDDGHHS